MSKIWVAELTSIQPYEEECVEICVYGVDAKKLYEIFKVECAKLYPNIDEWDWKGNHLSQECKTDEITWFAGMRQIELVC